MAFSQKDQIQFSMALRFPNSSYGARKGK